MNSGRKNMAGQYIYNILLSGGSIVAFSYDKLILLHSDKVLFFCHPPMELLYD